MERKYIEELKPTLNKQLPAKTLQDQQQYRQKYQQTPEYKQYRAEYLHRKIECPNCKTMITLGNKIKHSKTIKCQSTIV